MKVGIRDHTRARSVLQYDEEIAESWYFPANARGITRTLDRAATFMAV